jgi:hypothetical protein
MEKGNMTRFWAAIIVCLAICSVSLAVSLYRVSCDLRDTNSELNAAKDDLSTLTDSLDRLRLDIERLGKSIDVYAKGVENAGKIRGQTVDKLNNDPHAVDWMDRMLPVSVRDALARPGRCNDTTVCNRGAMSQDAIGADGDTPRSTTEAH